MEFANVLKANPYQDALGRFTTKEKAVWLQGGKEGATIMESPNEAEGLNLSSALRNLDSDLQRAAVKDAEAFAVELDLHSRAQSAIGAWADGAENSVVQQLDKVESFDQLRVVAARFGMKYNQKAVLPFKVDPKGPDALYEVEITGKDIETLHNELVDMGVEFHTLIPQAKSIRVMVYDEGRQMTKTMQKVGARYDNTVKVWKGQGEFLGSWDSREEGRAAYQDAIDRYESVAGHDRGVTRKGVHLDQREALTALVRVLKENPYRDAEGQYTTKENAVNGDSHGHTQGANHYATDKAAADAMGRALNGDLLDKLPADVLEGVASYRDFPTVNTMLRGGNATMEAKRQDAALTKAFAHAGTLAADTVVYRHVGKDVAKKLYLEYGELKRSDVVEPGWMSTSIAKEDAGLYEQDTAILVLRVPKGTKAVYAEPFGFPDDYEDGRPEEYENKMSELLFEKGSALELYEVKNIDGKTHFFAGLKAPAKKMDFVRVLKENPYRDAEGQYTTKENAVNLNWSAQLGEAKALIKQAFPKAKRGPQKWSKAGDGLTQVDQDYTFDSKAEAVAAYESIGKTYYDKGFRVITNPTEFGEAKATLNNKTVTVSTLHTAKPKTTVTAGHLQLAMTSFATAAGKKPMKAHNVSTAELAASTTAPAMVMTSHSHMFASNAAQLLGVDQLKEHYKAAGFEVVDKLTAPGQAKLSLAPGSAVVVETFLPGGSDVSGLQSVAPAKPAPAAPAPAPATVYDQAKDLYEEPAKPAGPKMLSADDMEAFFYDQTLPEGFTHTDLTKYDIGPDVKMVESLYSYPSHKMTPDEAEALMKQALTAAGFKVTSDNKLGTLGVGASASSLSVFAKVPKDGMPQSQPATVTETLNYKDVAELMDTMKVKQDGWSTKNTEAFGPINMMDGSAFISLSKDYKYPDDVLTADAQTTVGKLYEEQGFKVKFDSKVSSHGEVSIFGSMGTMTAQVLVNKDKGLDFYDAAPEPTPEPAPAPAAGEKPLTPSQQKHKAAMLEKAKTAWQDGAKALTLEAMNLAAAGQNSKGASVLKKVATMKKNLALYGMGADDIVALETSLSNDIEQMKKDYFKSQSELYALHRTTPYDHPDKSAIAAKLAAGWNDGLASKAQITRQANALMSHMKTAATKEITAKAKEYFLTEDPAKMAALAAEITALKKQHTTLFGWDADQKFISMEHEGKIQASEVKNGTAKAPYVSTATTKEAALEEAKFAAYGLYQKKWQAEHKYYSDMPMVTGAHLNDAHALYQAAKERYVELGGDMAEFPLLATEWKTFAYSLAASDYSMQSQEKEVMKQQLTTTAKSYFAAKALKDAFGQGDYSAEEKAYFAALDEYGKKPYFKEAKVVELETLAKADASGSLQGQINTKTAEFKAAAKDYYFAALAYGENDPKTLAAKTLFDATKKSTPLSRQYTDPAREQAHTTANALYENVKKWQSVNGSIADTIQAYDTEEFYPAKHAWVMQNAQQLDTLSQSVRNTLISYTGSYYKDINKTVGKYGTAKASGLNPAPLDPEFKKKIKDMDEAFAQMKLGSNLRLRRNMPMKYFWEALGIPVAEAQTLTNGEAQQIAVGKLYKETAFSSTSRDLDFSNTYSNEAGVSGVLVLNIRARAEHSGVAVETISKNSPEKEVILPRGTTYVVRSITKLSDKRYMADVDVVGVFPEEL